MLQGVFQKAKFQDLDPQIIPSCMAFHLKAKTQAVFLLLQSLRICVFSYST